MLRFLLLPAIALLVACGNTSSTSGSDKTAPPKAETPAEAARVFCACNSKVHEKYLPLMDAYKPDEVKDIPVADLPQAFRKASELGPEYGKELEACREQIKTFIQKVEKDKELGKDFGQELEKCMAPLIKESTPRLNNYGKYMDLLGKRQHDELKKQLDK